MTKIELIIACLRRDTQGHLRWSAAADELERMSASITNCSTEERLCYQNELVRIDAEINELQHLLRCALDEHDLIKGRVIGPSEHWSYKAHQLLPPES